ncbi:hypothetical protein C5167_022542 [Papaver somniferum]|uniref:Aldose 1-epimerase n=1 Tax=Papaver somniferum TaxID=3469 RepID=A0A4Y7JI31_PAPSO|nr:hypothetical protein C5167_022542 [Papaver somniferum]
MVKFSLVFCFLFISASFIDFAVATKKTVGYYEIKKGDISVTVTNYGATILSIKVPDNKGGHRGFGDVFWTVKNHQKDGQNPHITLTYDSFDGEQGFPGDLSVSVTYKLMKYNKLAVIMKAKPLNKATPVNLAQHTYWNLGGHNSGNILQNKIQIFGSQITPVDEELLPTGEITSVKNTPYDFLKPQLIGSRIDQLSSGYDINYVLNGPINSIIRKAAKFYTGNKLDNVKGKNGVVYKAHAGFCLETQGIPDAVNHPNFPSQIVNPGETYRHFMLYKFSAS